MPALLLDNPSGSPSMSVRGRATRHGIRAGFKTKDKGPTEPFTNEG